jgi:hypothetical protein
MIFQIGSCIPAGSNPDGTPIWSWTPTDISAWSFIFTMRSNYTYKQPAIAIQYNPVRNLADPTQGQLMWDIADVDTQPLQTGNYVFDMVVILSDSKPRFFCGGVIPLFDNVTDSVTLSAVVGIQIGTSIKANT